jgi:hypothetical protein
MIGIYLLSLAVVTMLINGNSHCYFIILNASLYSNPFITMDKPLQLHDKRHGPLCRELFLLQL